MHSNYTPFKKWDGAPSATRALKANIAAQIAWDSKVRPVMDAALAAGVAGDWAEFSRLTDEVTRLKAIHGERPTT